MQVSVARDSLAEAIELASTEVVILERYGKAVAVIVSPERYEELTDAYENVQDIDAFDQAMAEEGPDIPWEQVKGDLDWD